jgi:hypothetical protein
MDGIFTKNANGVRPDNIPINFNEAKQIAKDGGQSNIKITEASGAAFVLKEIGNAPSSGIAGNLYPFDETDTTAKGMVVDTMSDTTEDTANRITEEDCEELEEDGMSIERYNKERLSRLLEMRKVMNELEEAALESFGQKIAAKRENAEREGKEAAISRMEPKYAAIAERLIQADLPVTESNLSRIAEAVKMAGEAQFMTDASFSYLIENRLRPTVGNIYKAVHTGAAAKRTIDSDALLQLKNDIERVVSDAGFEPSEKTMQEAKSLIESGIPVTAENLAYREELGAVKDAFETGKVSTAGLTESAVATLKEGFAPKDMNLATVINREEIRLSGTVESLSRMRELGLEPDIEALTERLEDLKLKERNASKSALDGMMDEEDLKELFEKTLDARDAVEEAGEPLAARVFEARRTITLSEISVTAKSLTGTGRLQAASASYEASATEIRKDLGDSINKAFSGIEDILKSLDLEVNAANTRAVRMLGYNSIEITAENISEMKYFDSQIETLKNDLKPQVTAEIIKRGINPLETTVRELSAKAHEIAKELGTTPEERFSEYLVKLDRAREITAEQRESYIGIYRMLYSIEKTDGAAIGALVKSGRGLTLANLLTESRTLRKKTLDVSVDDDFGGLEARNYEGLSIDEQVAKAYGTRIAEETFRNATPGRLEKALERLSEQGKTPENGTLENLLENLLETPETTDDASYRTSRLDNFRQTISGNSGETEFLKQFEQEDSAVNIRAAAGILAQHGFERLKAVNERKNGRQEKLELREMPETEHELRNELEGIHLKASEMIETLYSGAGLTGREAFELKEVGNMIALKTGLLRRSFYEIPLEDEDGILNIHLTVSHESASRGSFLVSMEGIRASGTVSDENVTILITASSRETEGLIKKDGGLVERLKAAGFKGVHTAVSVGRLTPTYNGDNNTESARLYTAAKETVLYLRRFARTGENV